jgi:hypothetical protein
MAEIFQVIAFIAFGVFVLARRFAKKKKLADQDQESQDGGGTKLPSWLEKLVEGDEIQKPVLPQQEQAQTPPPEMEQRETDQPTVSSNQPEPEKEPASLVPTSTPSTERKVAGLPLSPKTFRQAIILSEILKPPKSVQK